MGYFVSGWPKAYVLPSDAALPPPARPVRQIILDPFDRHVLTVAEDGLYIWSAHQHRILLARFVLSDHVLREEGPLVAAAWSPNARIIVAGLRGGLVLFFSVAPVPGSEHALLSFDASAEPLVQPEPLPPLQLRRVSERRIAHQHHCLTAIVACPAGALITTSAASLTCIAWDGDMLWRVHVPELLRHNGGLAKMGVFGEGGEGGERGSPVLESIESAQGEDDVGGIRCVAYNRELGFCGIVLGSGPAFLLALQSGGRARPSAIDGRWLRATDAVSIALEPRRMLATVGLADGDVEQYYVAVPAGDRCPVMRRLSLSSWYFEPTDVGAATVIQWTEDGSALVVGWERRGLAVWSVSGCRLMWTLPQVGGALPATPARRHKDMRSSAAISPMEQGVLAAAWGPKGLFLWAAPRCSEESPSALQDCHFMEFTFFKGCVGSNFCQGDSSRLAMFGSDRVLLLWHADNSAEEDTQHSLATGNDLFSWQHLLIPHDYLWRNWPPKRIAVSSDASHVAVAGEYGVAICHVKTQKWRVFGDLEHDRRIRCCALAWVGRTIVIGNETGGSNLRGGAQRNFELLFYPRAQVESSALQAQRKLPSRPVLTDVRADGYLLVICEDAQVFLYQIAEQQSWSRIALREVYRLLLPTRELAPMYVQDKQANVTDDTGDDDLHGTPPAPGGGISEARIFPPLSHAPSTDERRALAPKHIMLLRSTGSLILLDTEKMMSTALLRYVERFWYTPVDCTPFDMIQHRPVWWAYGDDGLHVCFQDDMPEGSGVRGEDEETSGPLTSSSIGSFSSRSQAIDVEQWFELDPEVYPLSIMSKYGMLLGATQGLVTHAVDNEAGSMPNHLIRVKRQPILHTLLRHLLMKPMSDERTALQVALKCVPQPQFADSLEWLLYEAVLEHDEKVDVTINGKSIQAVTDKRGMHPKQLYGPRSDRDVGGKQFPESPRRKKSGSDLFPRVIRLLKYFGEYEDVVVRCARKLDSKRWPLLFSLAGEPAALLEQCFVSGRLRTAACLLVILQEMWGFISSTPHSLRLVEAALGREELGLAADLANFLSKADQAGMLNSSQLRTAEDVSWIAEVSSAPRGGALGHFSKRMDREGAAARIPAIDLAVLNHARWLLNKMDLRNLAALCVRMDFPLAEYLKRELIGKNVSKPFVRDLRNTILSLHRQFQYSEPNVHDVRRAMRVFNQETDTRKGRGADGTNLTELSEIGDGLQATNSKDDLNADAAPGILISEAKAGLMGPDAESLFGSQLPPPPCSYDSEQIVIIRQKAKQLCHQELSYLMTVARTARVPDITLCCATLLLDVSVLRMVLRGHEDLFEPYIAALNEFNVAGYDALVSVLTEIAAPR